MRSSHAVLVTFHFPLARSLVLFPSPRAGPDENPIFESLSLGITTNTSYVLVWIQPREKQHSNLNWERLASRIINNNEIGMMTDWLARRKDN